MHAPARQALERLLAAYAPLRPAPLCPEILVHRAHTLVAVWEAAEQLAGVPVPSPFWAWPWAGGCALARVLLDAPELVRGSNVLDFGAGGGVTALAAARAGSACITANDTDPWSLLVTRIAADAQQLAVELLADDMCEVPALVDDYDVVLCSDLAYERSQAPRQRAVLERALRNRATVLVADAGRTYFDPGGMQLLAEYQVDVPVDLEGIAVRTARCYRLVP
ncbi:MAG: methyltransferase domain-containing protein [Gemmatimonadota bacterium]